ncbi:DUF3805 domain-containing protein [Bacteroides sp. 214]|uniref:DUF3805 domain-containing protein n=1 Tax=Bacteroides sp. 214 TaxID=2302935 RepID=UPI00351BA916
MSGKKFISPGAWFSLYYPINWHEFEDMEGSFLFYDPVDWTGNFRISAFKKDESFRDAMRYGSEAVKKELKENAAATLVTIGKHQCAYSQENFQEKEIEYTSHIWVFGQENVSFECSFTVPKGKAADKAKQIISTVEIRKDGVKYPAETIPVRIAEISLIDESYRWTTELVKATLKKDFQGAEEDLPKLQSVIDNGNINTKKRDAWNAIGITLCVIIANEIEGMEWVTLIDGNREAPVLCYKNEQQIDPMKLVWSKVKAGEICDVVEAYKNVIANL